MQEAHCRSCGAKILWIHSAYGNLMPLDATPTFGGNIAIIDGKAHTVSKDLFSEVMPEGPRYQSHFASCPSAEKHRKKKG